jgi:peptidoglycan/LPS O-acetylase OafA/YrhL
MIRSLTAPASTTARAHTYRPDIDGLRAIAVLAVVVFHAFPSALPGGFAGVDIFFVISGYLITSLLLADLQAGRFSLAAFYVRRIRRIFPTLVTVLLATYAIGWICLTGDEYKQLGKHILAGVGFVSNWALWTEAGYFDQAASTKPLLHLWSLGVEEQFYIVWPLLLALAFRFRRCGWMLAVVGTASFFANLVLVRHYAPAAFYWPISRMWELLAGGALTMATPLLGQGARLSAARGSLSLVGLVLCVVSFVVLKPSLGFPGAWAVLPVLGAICLISAGYENRINRHVLGSPVAVQIGKISYALYLWHWPLISFVHILAGEEPTAAVRPIRFGKPSSWKWILPCVLMIGVGYLGGMTYVRGGLGFRKGYSPDADVSTARLGAGGPFTSPTCGLSSADQQLFHFCATDKRAPSHFAVWGDSKGDALYWGLVRASEPGESWTLIGRPSCAPMVGVSRITSDSEDAQRCRQANQIALHMLLHRAGLTSVVLVIAERDVIGQQFAYDGQDKAAASAALAGLENDITTLEHAGKRVALVLDNPSLRDPRQCMDRRPLAWPFVRHALGVADLSADKRCAISYSSHVERMAPYQALVDALRERHPELLVYDPAQVLCDIKRNVCPMTMNRAYLYSYGDHVSDYANGLMARQFLPLFRHWLARPIGR